MICFVDASAMVAMMTGEPERDELLDRLATASRRLYSAVVGWETAAAIARKRTVSATEASADVTSFASDMGIDAIHIGIPEMTVALDAFDRYGKRSGTEAQLNMGDCFAYACAKTNGAQLLYKGDDFRHTDLA